ncbi:MAG: hypothetical protein IPJ65_40435 [Archangiaceae bacterium]|nr:hypothetical protein [Archangiaceae bacterium]
MAAKNLRLVEGTIELDAPEQGLQQALDEIAADLHLVGQVRRDVKSWALIGAAASSAASIVVITALFMFFMPSAPPPAIVINPAPVAVVVTPPPAAVVEAAVPAASPAPVARREELPALSASAEGVRRALSALWASRPKTALREADAVLAAEPRDVDALAARALALYDLHRDRAARASVKQALKLDPKHPLANVLRGIMAQADHDIASALAHYEKYLRQHPTGALADELVAVRQNIEPAKHEEKGKP